MNKTLDPKTIAELSRYTAEELDPALADNDTAVDEFIKRNENETKMGVRVEFRRPECYGAGGGRP